MGKMTPVEIEEARRVMAIQASTRPQPNEHGETNIGPTGAWERASAVLTRPGSPFSGRLADVPLTPEMAGLGITRERARPGRVRR